MGAKSLIEPRRFWTRVAVEPEADGFAIRLDERSLRTPAQAPLRVPTRALAEAIAAEWRAIADVVRPEALPFTRAANVAIDRVAPAPGPVIDMLAAYGESDLICHRASAPEALRRRQAEAWDPLLYWSAEALGAPLLPVVGLMPQDQPPASLAALRAEVARHGAFGLVALHDLVTLSGSLVIGLAVALRARPPDEGWALSRIDEIWQAEAWGDDDEAAAAAALRATDFLRAARLHEMLAGSAFAAPQG